jgi:hypothetical protein
MERWEVEVEVEGGRWKKNINRSAKPCFTFEFFAETKKKTKNTMRPNLMSASVAKLTAPQSMSTYNDSNNRLMSSDRNQANLYSRGLVSAVCFCSTHPTEVFIHDV